MIRFAKEEDLEEILDIYNDAIANTTAIYTYELETLDDRKKWYRDRLKNNLPVIVYEKDNKVVGFASFGPFRPYAAYKFTIEHSVYVNKNYRSKGIGGALLGELIDIAKSNGYKTLIGVIDALNKDSLILHEKFGFDFVGVINHAGYKFEKWLDLVFYQLDLSKIEPECDIKN